jgi:L-ascorbate metabolism protein UlaG (beta-lactamase superfamily)
MKITWLGHAGFRIETGGAVLLVDPWLTGNPMFPADRRAEAIAGTTHLLVSHGHDDHSADAVAIAKETGATILCIVELASQLSEEGLSIVAFNKGGTVEAGDAKVTMVHAVHSSSKAGYAGSEAGFMIAAEDHVIYFSGDTDVMADMAVFQDLHKPDIGLLACGGFYTMDMERAAYAARKFFDFDLIIPCHYRTFPALAQSAEPLIRALPGVTVTEPEVLVPITV